MIEGIDRGLFTEDPWNDYKDLAAAGAVVWSPAQHAYVVFGYREASLVLQSSNVTVERARRNSREAFGGPTLLDLDGEAHLAIRNAMLGALKLSRMESYREHIIAPHVAQLLSRLNWASLNWTRAIAEPLPVLVIGALLGIPEDRAGWLLSMLAPLRALIDHGRIRPAELDASLRTLRAYLTELLDAESFTKSPLGSMLGEAWERGELTRDALLDNVVLLLVAGTATTQSVLAFLAARYVSTDDRGRGLMESALDDGQLVGELCRLESPVRFTPRFARCPIEVGGVNVDSEQTILVCLASANRDPRVFDGPDEWRNRGGEPKPLTFGRGTHSCVGALLAETETLTTFKMALPQLRRSTLRQPLTLRKGWTLRTPAPILLAT